jgi:hypothetical protein
LLYPFAVGAFVALFFLHVPFPLTIALAALGGVVLQRWQPDAFHTAGHSRVPAAGLLQSATESQTQQ